MEAQMILAHGGPQWGWGAWAWLVVPVVVYCLISLTLFVLGRGDDDSIAKFDVIRFFFGHISDSLRRATGFPGWSMAGVLSGLMALLIAVIGLYWDVAWHIDNGRDTQLFTVSHVMILVGLGGLIYTSALTVLFATLDEADVALRAGPLRIPWSAVLLLALGVGAVAAFPLDNLWHETYGLDVTLWSPTHLQLVGGGSLGTIALFLMCAEALPHARPTWLGRAIFALTGGTVLVGMSTFQGEFDFGVPQFQVLYLPLLIMAAAGFSLVLTRIALGPWGAVKAVIVFLILRGFLAFAVGGVLHHTVPRFPLYLASALAVEAAAWWLGTERRLRLAVGAGALVGTVGLLGELAFVGLSGWSMGRLPLDLAAKIVVLGPVAALAAAVLGAGLARGFSRHEQDHVPVAALALAGVGLVAVLAYPLPRNVGQVEAVIRTEPVGERVVVDVELDPPDAAGDASAFAVTSWQGGGRVTALLEEVAPGRYRSAEPVPVTPPWKSTVGLMRGDQVMAAPVFLPADPEIGASEVPLVPERRVAFVRNTELLLREAHGGPAWPAYAAYSGFAAVAALWVALMARTTSHVPVPAPAPAPGPPVPRWSPSPPLASTTGRR